MTNILEKETQAVIAEWNAIKPTVAAGAKAAWKSVSGFMLNALDVFVIAVEPMILAGGDKKVAVLTAISLTYDSVVAPLMPFYLKPFNSAIKAFIIMTLASSMIDFVVKQYNKMGGVPMQAAS
jgi:hypothetical protein